MKKPCNKECMTCKYAGMDMDMDPYCIHPKVAKDYPYGLVLHSPTIAKYCPAPEHPLWKQDPDRK